MRHLYFLLLFVPACGQDTQNFSDSDGATGGMPDASVATTPDLSQPGVVRDMAASNLDGSGASLIAQRPYPLHVPPGYDKNTPTPLVILLHGYSASGALQEAYFKLTPVADAHNFLYATPDGTVDQTGQHFWNADDACCDLYHVDVDDVAYINAIIDDVEQKYNVDEKRVFLVGHSNGAFMSHRMACDSAPRIAAIAALAGEVWNDMSKCKPADHVSVLQVHGTADAVIAYNGGQIAGVTYPSSAMTVAFWAQQEGCNPVGEMESPLDLESTLPGSETTVEKFSNCISGDVEFWSIVGGSHVPSLQPTWGEMIWSYLSTHPKP
jgi:polyhydroxybutyrate depolymerase